MTNKGRRNYSSNSTTANNTNNTNNRNNRNSNSKINTNRLSATSNPTQSFPEKEKPLKVCTPDLVSTTTITTTIEKTQFIEDSCIIDIPTTNVSDSSSPPLVDDLNEENDAILTKENDLAESTVDKTGSEIINQIIDELYQSCFDDANKREDVLVKEIELSNTSDTKTDESVSSMSSIQAEQIQAESNSDNHNSSNSKIEEDEVQVQVNNTQPEIKIIEKLFEKCLDEIQTETNETKSTQPEEPIETVETIETVEEESQKVNIIEINPESEITTEKEPILEEVINLNNDVNIIEIDPTGTTQDQLNQSSISSQVDLEIETNKINELLKDMTEKINTNLNTNCKIESKELNESSRLLNATTSSDELEKDYVIPRYESLEEIETKDTKAIVTRSVESIQVCETPIAPPRKQVVSATNAALQQQQIKTKRHTDQADNTCAFCCFI